MSQSGKLTPNLDQNSTKVLNLTVLQRMDPYIEEILITAAHVTFYGFNVDLNQWSRKDVEGSLFVVKRNTQPRFQFIVMNRRNTENLVENLLGDFEFELQVPYLLYRNASQEVNGIWFYNSRESEDVANLFTRILGAYSKVPPNSQVNKSEFEELEAVPTSAVTEGSLEPQFTTPSSIDVPDDSSFVNFFSSAINLGRTSNSFSSVKPYHNSTMVPLSSPATPSPLLNNGLTIQIIPSTAAMPPRMDVNNVTNLFRPLSFFTPSSALLSPTMPQTISSSLSVTALQPPLNMQRSHGVPLLQPFPPPTPPLSLTPNSTSTSPLNYGPLTREKVRDALMLLAQDNQFIDMLYQALLKVYQQS